MSSSRNDSTVKTLTVAFLLCIVCSIFVAGSAVLLKPVQARNSTLNMKENILRAANLLSGPTSAADIDAKFKEIQPRIVDLETGEYVEPAAVGKKSIDEFDQFRAAKDPAYSEALGGNQDIASIKRRERYVKVYLYEVDGKVERVVLPVRGYGLWSTLYGFLALEGDANTVVGLGFYQHAETPGLGGEVDNPNWKALWPGKKVYDLNEGMEPRIHLVKGGVQKNDPNAMYGVDALSGASLTSRGVTNLLHFWLGEQGFQKYLEHIRSGEANNV